VRINLQVERKARLLYMLEGKVAIVTGAGRGIGRGIALTLAKAGATVIVNYNGSKQSADEVVSEIMNNGGNAEAIQCNVSDFNACAEFTKGVLDKYKRVDILVNNAGVTRDNLIMRMSEEDFDTVIDTNLKGAFNMIKHLSRNFIKQKSGKIINISSVSGVMGNAGQANYSASKAGVIGLTKSVAREFASRGINVNAVAPGFIDTDMTKNMTDDAKSQVNGMIPMGKMGTTSDIANLVLFLASDNSNYITGQVICVDGGMAI
jgi:3-oxoacyl-[acyl-carrier protein] reductase